MLSDLDLSVAPGRSLVIIGGSGQGKSVTIKIAAGLMGADAGQMLVDGKDIAGLPPKARRRGPGADGHAVPGQRPVRQPDGLGEQSPST